jgi:hypothetical protein
MVGQRFIKQEHLDILLIGNNHSELVQQLSEVKIEAFDKWIDRKEQT